MWNLIEGIYLVWLFMGLVMGWVFSGMYYIRRGNKKLEDYIASQKESS